MYISHIYIYIVRNLNPDRAGPRSPVLLHPALVVPQLIIIIISPASSCSCCTIAPPSSSPGRAKRVDTRPCTPCSLVPTTAYAYAPARTYRVRLEGMMHGTTSLHHDSLPKPDADPDNPSHYWHFGKKAQTMR